MGRRHRGSDPYWATAKFDGIDANGVRYGRGERIFIYPNSSTVLAGAAAELASRDFQNARADEAMETGSY